MVRSLALLVVAEVFGLSLWFSAAAVLPGLAAEAGTSLAALAGLTTATQIGFVSGALFLAATGLPDRVDPRLVFAASCLAAAAANAALLVLPPEGLAAHLSRAAVGAALAGVYPVGLKIAVGWSERRRGLITGLLVGALTLGSALPHLVVLTGGPGWRATIIATSALAALASALILAASLGPFHRSPPPRLPGRRRMPSASGRRWRSPRSRSAGSPAFPPGGWLIVSGARALPVARWPSPPPRASAQPSVSAARRG